jgi:hypothetical protein
MNQSKIFENNSRWSTKFVVQFIDH